MEFKFASKDLSDENLSRAMSPKVTETANWHRSLGMALASTTFR